MTVVILMCIFMLYIAISTPVPGASIDEQPRQQLSLFVSLISPISLRFDSGLCDVTSDSAQRSATAPPSSTTKGNLSRDSVRTYSQWISRYKI